MTPSAAPAERPLGFWSLLCLGINGIVGVGIFFAPREVGSLVPGTAGVGVYALVALVLAPVAVVYATLGGRFAEDGGPYVWAREAFGTIAGFGVGWIAWVSALFSTAAVVAGLSEHAAPLFGVTSPVGARVFALACVVTLALVAASGLRPSAWAWNAVTVLKLLPLALLVVAFARAGAPLPAPASESAAPAAFARAMLVVVFATQGFEIVPVPAGNARRTGIAVPAATVAALAVAGTLYVALHAACVALPSLAAEPAPLVAAARLHGGDGLARVVAAGTNLSALGIAFGMFAMTPRYLAALGGERGLGRWLARESSGHVPLPALCVTALGVALLVQLGRLGELFALSSVAVLAQYAVSSAALAALCVRRRAGLALRHAWPVPLALGAIALVGRAASLREVLVAGGVLALGGLLWLGRRTRIQSG